MQEYCACRVDDSHQNERKCESDGDRHSILMLRDDSNTGNRNEVHEDDAHECDNVKGDSGFASPRDFDGAIGLNRTACPTSDTENESDGNEQL